MLCDYGCGQQATHQFKNGKWCCSKFSCQCPVIKEKNSNYFKKNNPWNKGIKGEFHHTKETKQKMSISKQGEKHHLFGKQRKKETINKIILTQRRTIQQIKERYPTFSKIEEMRYEPDKENEKVIQVHCKNHNCKNSKEQDGWFTPTKTILNNRISCIENPLAYGECHFYCSDKCKQVCPLFGIQPIQIINQNKLKKELYSQEEYQTWRTTVLARENYICEYCDERATHVHHSRPQKLEPGFALDPDFGIACCEKHHYQYGHKPGTECSTGNLANKVCS